MPKARVHSSLANASQVNALVVDHAGNVIRSQFLGKNGVVLSGLTDEQARSLEQTFINAGQSMAFSYVRAYNQEVLKDSPSYYWRLSDAGPTNATPAAGSVTGTFPSGSVFRGASMVADDTAPAWTTPASQPTSATFGDIAAFGGLASFSLDFWYTPPGPFASQYLATKKGTTVESTGWHIVQNSGGTITFARIVPGSGGTASASTTTGTVTVGQAAHIAVTFDGPSNTSRIFINGALSKSTVHTAAPAGIDPASSARPLALGGWAASPGTAASISTPFSDFAIYNYRLSDERVYGHYVSGKYGYL